MRTMFWKRPAAALAGIACLAMPLAGLMAVPAVQAADASCSGYDRPAGSDTDINVKLPVCDTSLPVTVAPQGGTIAGQIHGKYTNFEFDTQSIGMDTVKFDANWTHGNSGMVDGAIEQQVPTKIGASFTVPDLGTWIAGNGLPQTVSARFTVTEWNGGSVRWYHLGGDNNPVYEKGLTFAADAGIKLLQCANGQPTGCGTGYSKDSPQPAYDASKRNGLTLQVDFLDQNGQPIQVSGYTAFENLDGDRYGLWWGGDPDNLKWDPYLHVGIEPLQGFDQLILPSTGTSTGDLTRFGRNGIAGDKTFAYTYDANFPRPNNPNDLYDHKDTTNDQALAESSQASHRFAALFDATSLTFSYTSGQEGAMTIGSDAVEKDSSHQVSWTAVDQNGNTLPGLTNQTSGFTAAGKDLDATKVVYGTQWKLATPKAPEGYTLEKVTGDTTSSSTQDPNTVASGTMGARNQAVVLHYRAASSRITFQPGDPKVTGSITPLDGYVGDQATLPDATGYTWDHHTFTGWKDPDGGEHKAGDKIDYPKGGLTLTAQWRTWTYTVRYDKGADDATGGMGDQAMTFDQSARLTANGFKRSGWRFTGWKDQNGKTYQDAQEAINLAANDGETVTLTAQWARTGTSTLPSTGAATGLGVLLTAGLLTAGGMIARRMRRVR
ncbi:hypothetical protein [Bifidobacterium callimiconis]|uniref:Uncharacterized protein n=1 Tax=Bifidobacterium callimiconis TaxID=2306973 RepID=A0A430FEM8_9BIFI|nr:hypothetical protein [Bifidobacterium callimiconis]RSX51260.1 hypothetical protein D2E23_1105 [Bifidobacterium callimiconis]